jgi:hypothetical protein
MPCISIYAGSDLPADDLDEVRSLSPRGAASDRVHPTDRARGARVSAASHGWSSKRWSMGAPESTYLSSKFLKRIGFGVRRFAHYRIRALLYAGRPKRALATVTLR